MITFTSPERRDEKLKELYLAGFSRRAAMAELGIQDMDLMLGASMRLCLHWSWPLSNRKKGVAPPVQMPIRVQAGGRQSADPKHSGVPASVRFHKFVDGIAPAELKRGVEEPFHLSRAFPAPREYKRLGLTASVVFWIAQMYVRDFRTGQPL